MIVVCLSSSIQCSFFILTQKCRVSLFLSQDPGNPLNSPRKSKPVIEARFSCESDLDALPEISLDIRPDPSREPHDIAPNKFPECIESRNVFDPDVVGEQPAPDGFQVSQQDAPADNVVGPPDPVLFKGRNEQRLLSFEWLKFCSHSVHPLGLITYLPTKTIRTFYIASLAILTSWARMSDWKRSFT
jgi:hypothetical protein